MGRPRKEGMDYFPHDVDAAQDEKIEAMRSMFGNDGYAFYFITLERIYRSDHGEFDVSNRLYLLTLANKVMVMEKQLLDMIQAAVRFGLFDKDEFEKRNVLTSNGIKKRMIQINSLRDKWRNKKTENDENILGGKLGFSIEKSGFSRGNTTVFPLEKCIKESKEKKSKVKESNKTLYAEHVLLFDSEYNALVEEHGNEFTEKCIEILDNYKGQSGTKYKSDYRAILNWVVNRMKEEKSSQKPKSPDKPISQKPKMSVATQEQNTTDEDYQEALRIARLLDGLED